MHRLFSIFFFLFASALTAAEINGFVSDVENKAPLVGVNIVVAGTGRGASTDADGHYIIRNMPAGHYSISASMMGYTRQTKNIALADDEIVSVNFAVHPTVLQLGGVQVVGEAERNLMQNPATESPGLELSTSVVTRREIKRQGAKTVIDALQYIPGALIETRGRKIKQFFSTRGQRYPYPDYAVNGAWQREFLETPYFFSSADIERIEVIRSSAALLTGVNGLAGIVNIITKEYDAPQTMAETEYGSFGTFRAHISHGAKIGAAAYAVGVGTQHTDGPDRLHAAESRNNFYGSLHWTPSKKISIRATLFHLNGKRELRLAESPAAKRFRSELWSYDPVRSTLANIKLNYNPSEKAGSELLLYYTNRDPLLIKEDETTHEITRISEGDYEWGANFTQALSLSENNTLRFGGLLNHWIAPNGKRFYVGRRNDLQTLSAVVVDEHRIGRWTIDGGGRWAQTYINEYGAFGIHGSGKGFAKVTPITDQWQAPTFQTSLGAARVSDNLWTLTFHGAAGVIKPPPGSLDINLKEPQNETRIKVDVGAKKLWPGVGQASLTAFATLQKNAIILSGDAFEGPDRIMELYRNRLQNNIGLEFEARTAQVFQSVEAFANATVMRARAETDGKMQQNSELPQVIAGGGIYLAHGNFDAAVLGKYISAFESVRFAAKTADGRLPAQPLGDYFSVDMNLGWTLGNIYNTRLYLEINNLTNVAYSTVVGYPDFGRRTTIGVRQTL